ncbi:methyltransferase [Miniimonas sp. S16]|uniref:methyltransferase n=1 Tax=Miniimonas sp. S16 TaxID=2171623 RepID=UPI000D529491|nr:methyltransferase [Miniimonas sp. S16]
MTEVVLTVLAGVAPAAQRELERLGWGPQPTGTPVATAVPVATAEELRVTLPRSAETMAALQALRTVVAAFLVVTSPAPRPTGLLATAAVRAFAEALEAIAWQRPRVRFHGLRLEAAGAHTPEMGRLATELAELADVPVDDDDGDLVVRVRRAPDRGWELLVRTTPRPLATRAWRTESYPGALNATIAAAAVDELGVSPSDAFADLMCGSGTLLIERMARGPAARLLAADASAHAIDTTQRHLRGARVRGRVETRVSDVAALARDGGTPDGEPTLAGAFTTVVANPPWGELWGEHATNATLYADLLDAVDRLGTREVRAGVLTHDIRRFEAVLADDPRWRVVAMPQFFAKGHRPRLFVLRRAD